MINVLTTYVQVLDIAKGGPCDGQDVMKDDIITHVDHTRLAGKQLEEIMYLVLGEEGAETTLTLKRGLMPHSYKLLHAC